MRVTLVAIRVVLALVVSTALSCGLSWAQSESCNELALGPEAMSFSMPTNSAGAAGALTRPPSGI